MRRPRHLLRAWPDIRGRLRSAKRLVLLTDFDGTLAPIRPRPEQARPLAGVSRLLAEAAAAGCVVGVISGRRLEDVRRLMGVEGIWYAGAHGFFLRSPTGLRLSLLKAKERREIAGLTRRLRRMLRGLPGIVVEAKGATVAVHYRRAARRVAAKARERVQRFLRLGVSLLEGKKVWEFLPQRSSPVNKWAAIRLLLRREGIGGREQRATVYLGDDATDEAVFEALGGITVAVGKRHETAARYYLRAPREVQRFLKLWKGVNDDRSKPAV